jgi:hypothetical protein
MYQKLQTAAHLTLVNITVGEWELWKWQCKLDIRHTENDTQIPYNEWAKCNAHTTALASSSSLLMRGIKYSSQDISRQCLGQKQNSMDIVSVTSLLSSDSPGKVDPKCVNCQCLCPLNTSPCDTPEKGQKRTYITEPMFSIQLHISLICDNSVTTQNLWFFGTDF